MKIAFIKRLTLLCFALNALACSSTKDQEDLLRTERETPEIPEITEAPETPETSETDGAWELVFEDEFNTNLDQWNIWQGGAFNNEIQLYTTEQLTLENGLLTITAERKSATGATTPFNTTPKDFNYVSGRLKTKTQFGPSNTEGENEYRIVSRIKLPEGTGMWPAFWTYADPWPTNGEIDILEARGNRRTTFQSNIFYGTAPNMPLTKDEDTAKNHQLNTDITDNFHTYELIWKANSLAILFDNVLLHTYIADSKNFVAELFGKKQQIALNLAVGGVFFEGISQNQFVSSATMQVDWVRVYKK